MRNDPVNQAGHSGLGGRILGSARSGIKDSGSTIPTPGTVGARETAGFRLLLCLPVVGLFSVAVILYFRFSAEDAFITYRYAENLVTLGALVFNEGERILALTSPLHGLLSAVLFKVTGHTVVANKLLGGIMLLGAAAMTWQRYRNRTYLQPLVAALILLPPCIVLWSFGGLETPLLLLIVTAATLLAAERSPPDRWRLCGIFLLAGLAFLTRFDSVLYTSPLLLYSVLRSRSLRDVGLAAVAGAALPVGWLAVSSAYYGDIFPTSFYAKTPSLNIPVMIGNGKYVLFYLGLIGILPVLMLALGLVRGWSIGMRVVLGHVRDMWWLYLGISAQLLYGLTMAQTHMMFSFRYFVPYIPAFAVLTVDLTGRAMDARRVRAGQRRLIVAGAVIVLLGFQGFQIHYTHVRSVNGLSPWGEYPSTGVRHYTRFIETLRLEGEAVRRHWETQVGSPERMPRIYTYAGGVLPYTFRDSYVYETLVSYRHCPPAESDRVRGPNLWADNGFDLRLSADYIHILTPRHGPVEAQLPLPPDRYSLISSFELEFDGSRENFLVFYRPDPDPHILTSTLSGRCTD